MAAEAGGPHRGAHGPGGMVFRSDANSDGVVTRAEFDASRTAEFTRLDADSNGQVTREERRAAFRAMRENRPQNAQGERRRGLDRVDANSDGNISREEFLARPAQHFERLDANKNGVIEVSERPQPRQRGEGRREGNQGWTNPDTDGN